VRSLCLILASVTCSLAAGAEAPDIDFTLAPGFQLETVLKEPAVRQPLAIHFDERGRMWVTQYRQFPFPAGLKVVGHDRYWRIQYDNFPPPPPPNHIEGRDVVSIFHDPDGDGAFTHHKDFVSGLNICTAAVPGRGGVWVLNPPYLLFYPDTDRDDVPDGDPEVHLAGFGLEDLHAVANGLRWGPDGWLYGYQGSTTTANITRPGLDEEGLYFEGQNCWRYHPADRRFELFSEGGYNHFGLALDAEGRWFTGSNGGNIGIHHVQGGNYWKNWGKHGELTNPYAFGFFPAMEDHSTRAKLSQGLVIYDAPQWPEAYQNTIITARALQRRISVARLEPRGSTYAAYENDQQLVDTDDQLFRPVGMTLGPDGALYIADWHDTNITWNVSAEGDRVMRETGRIYRVTHGDHKPAPDMNLGTARGEELIAHLKHPNKWYRETALRVLYDRVDETLIPAAENLLFESTNIDALNGLWAFNACGGLTPEHALRALDHATPMVRFWTVRLLGDDGDVPDTIAAKLTNLADTEQHPQVRSQLASTARRLDPAHGLAIVGAMLASGKDTDDPHIPLLLWWAVEGQIRKDRDAVVAWVAQQAAAPTPLFADTIVPRLGRRFVIDHDTADFHTAADMLDALQQDGLKNGFLRGMADSLGDGPADTVPDRLRATLAEMLEANPEDTQLMVIAARLGNTDVLDAAANRITDDAVPTGQRTALMEMLGREHYPAARDPMLSLFTTSNDQALRKAALSALQQYGDPEVGKAFIHALASNDPLTSRLAAALVTRPDWATRLLEAVDGGTVAADKIARDLLANLAALNDPEIDALVRKHWGAIRQSPDDALAKVNGVYAIVKNGPGDRKRGITVYEESCGKCHVLHGVGRAVGPELTGIGRGNLWDLATEIVDPNRSILPEYVGTTFTVVGEDLGFGPEKRVINGFLLRETNQAMTIVDTAGNELTVPREEVLSMEPMRLSIMPEGLLDGMPDQKLRDLFAFLQSEGE
jgi:putative membrane-bound dehydrogenase-like protein